MFESVFIIDDNPIDRLIATRVIESIFNNCSIKEFEEAASALVKLEEIIQEEPIHFPHLILLDINMPVMDGFSFLDRFITLPSCVINNCFIFMLSSSVNYTDISRAMQYSVVDTFISKPLTIEVLKAILQNKFSQYAEKGKTVNF